MKKLYRHLQYIFFGLSALLLNIMGYAVGYHCCYTRHHPEYAAPATVVFLLVLPYAAGIAICACLSLHFRKKRFKRNEEKRKPE